MGVRSNCDDTEVFDCPHNKWIYGLLLCQIRLKRQQKKRTLCVIVTMKAICVRLYDKKGKSESKRVSEWW